MDYEPLTMNDIRLLQSLDRKFIMDMESKRLMDCGWADFDGITIGGEPINTAKLLAGAYIQARPHPVYEGEYVYRIATVGWDAIEPYPDDTFALTADESRAGGEG